MKHRVELAIKALAFCAGAFLFGGPAWAKGDPIILAQSDKWIANFDAESCQLISSFGEGDGKVLVRFTRYAPGDAFTLDLFGKPFGRLEGRNNVRFAFGPSGSSREVLAFSATSASMPMLMLGTTDFLGREAQERVKLPLIGAEKEAQIAWLEVEMPEQPLLHIKLGSMVGPLRVMNTCMAGLVQSWGFDPDEQSKSPRHALPKNYPGNWITQNDYPADLVRQGASGMVVFRLDVDETGKATGCHIQQRTKPDSFADLSCKLLLKRAKFSPALNKMGTPIRSLYSNTIQWLSNGDN